MHATIACWMLHSPAQYTLRLVGALRFRPSAGYIYLARLIIARDEEDSSLDLYTTMRTVIYALLALSLLAILAWYASAFKTKLPPGPPGLPFVGNVLDLDAHELWSKANRWGKRFGELVYLSILGTPFLFIERGETAIELLHKRSHIYSDRPHLTMAGEMCGLDALVPLTRNDRLKNERKLLNQALSPTAIKEWRPALSNEVLALLQNLAQQPDQFVEHFNRLAGSMILNAVYGYHVQANGDPLVHAAEELMKVSAIALQAGWLVDFLTFLKWIPGTKWRKLADEWRTSMRGWVDMPYEVFKNLPDSPEKRASFCNTMLTEHDRPEAHAEFEERVKWMATSLYGAGLDTSVVVLSQFVLAMVLHPHIQRGAQEEIDRIVGRDRLPKFTDRDSLPLVDCILKETLRWGTPVPLTPPHRLTQADDYNDMHFPKGSLFNANIWSMLHDERVYSDPLEFRPERFLNKEKQETESNSLPPSDPYTYAFGFGRRRCPGVHFADQTLWLAMSCILACFDMKPCADEAGATVLPEVAFDGGVFRHPKPFKCRIVPRHENASRLLQKTREV